MSALSSLLVQDQIVSVSAIEEALQRQVIFGGQLDTNLLELRAANEELIVEYKARVAGMPPASADELDDIDIQLIRSVPAAIAERYTIVPLQATAEGLQVAVCQSENESELDQAAKELNLVLEPLMTSELRLRAALSRYYGVRLPSRFSRLAGLLAASPVAKVVPKRRPTPTLSHRAVPSPRPRRTSRPPQAKEKSRVDTQKLIVPRPDQLGIPPAVSSKAPDTDEKSADFERSELGTVPEAVIDGDVARDDDETERTLVPPVENRPVVEVAPQVEVETAAASVESSHSEAVEGESPVEMSIVELSPAEVLAEERGEELPVVELLPAEVVAVEPFEEARIIELTPSEVVVAEPFEEAPIVELIPAEVTEAEPFEQTPVVELTPPEKVEVETVETISEPTTEDHAEPEGADLEPSAEEPPAGEESAEVEVAPSEETSTDSIEEIAVEPPTPSDSLVESVVDEDIPPAASPGVEDVETPQKKEPAGAGRIESRPGLPPPPGPMPEPLDAPPEPPTTPLTLEAGLQFIDGAVNREEVFESAVRVAGGLFDYAAVFVVKGIVAHCKAAFGAGTRTEILTTIPVSLEKPGILWTVTQTRSHYMGPIAINPPNDNLLHATDRHRPLSAVVVPVVLKDRVVVLLYADSKPGQGRLDSVTPLLFLGQAMSKTFERLIMERKRGTLFSSAPPGPPPDLSAGPPSRPVLPVSLRTTEAYIPGIGSKAEAVESETGMVGIIPEVLAATESLGESLGKDPTPASASDEATSIEEALIQVGSGEVEAAGPDENDGEGESSTSTVAEDVAVLTTPSLEVISADEPALDTTEPTTAEGENRPIDEADDDENALGDERDVEVSVEVEERQYDSVPTVIVDMGEDIESIVERALDEGDDADEAVEELLGLGEECLPVLVRRFPGDVKLDWQNLTEPVAEPGNHGKLLGILRSFGGTVVPYLIPTLNSHDPAKRFFAVLVLGTIDDEVALESVGQKLLDSDPRVASLAGSVLSKDAAKKPLPPTVFASIRIVLEDRQAPEIFVHRAADAARQLRDHGAVPQLIDLLRAVRGAKKITVLNALRQITGQDFGNSARRWSGWWKKFGHKNRVEWLIDALDHRNERVRATAGRELTRIVPDDFGYVPTGTRREREEARRRYSQWWEENGRGLHQGRD